MNRIIKRLSVLFFVGIMALCVISTTFNTAKEVSTPIRNVELTKVKFDYEESLKTLDDYSIEQYDGKFELKGLKFIDSSYLESFENLSNETIPSCNNSYISFDFAYDTETNIVSVSAYMDNELGSLDMDIIYGVAFINDNGEFDAAMNVDGECIFLSEMADNSLLQNCGLFKKLLKAVVVTATVALVTTAVVAATVATAGVAATALVAVGATTTVTSTASLATGAIAGYLVYEISGKKAVEAAMSIDTNDYGSISISGGVQPPNNNKGNKDEKPDYSDDATSQNQMQKKVEKGQAPKEVDRVDKAHDVYGQDHVHFKDGTSLNKDGSIHDAGKGIPNLSNKVLEWLNENGWCLNGIKY